MCGMAITGRMKDIIVCCFENDKTHIIWLLIIQCEVIHSHNRGGKWFNKGHHLFVP